jgi:hypothetical protein
MSTKYFQAVPIQVIDCDDGAILKRGCSELKIIGREVPLLIRRFLAFVSQPRTVEEMVAFHDPL